MAIEFQITKQFALLYGDFLHFDPENSPFVNLFDISRADRANILRGFLHTTFLIVSARISVIAMWTNLGSTCAKSDLRRNTFGQRLAAR